MTFKLMNGSQGKLTFSRTFDLCYPPNEYVIHVASFDFSLVTALYMGMLAMQLNPYPKSKVNHIETT